LLSDSDIEELIQNRRLRIGRFREENLTPNGYDLTIGEILIPSLEKRICEGIAEIPGLTWFLVGTDEIVELPEEISGELWIKTSWARKGVISSFGKVDAGFRGNLTLSALNASKDVLEISIGQRFAQIVFSRLQTNAARGYEDRSGNYQDQRGITLEPKKFM